MSILYEDWKYGFYRFIWDFFYGRHYLALFLEAWLRITCSDVRDSTGTPHMADFHMEVTG